MDPNPQEAAFAHVVEALELVNPIPVQFIGAVQQFPDYHPQRDECPVPDARDKPQTVIDLLETGNMDELGGIHWMPRVQKIEDGLRDLQWSSWPHGPRKLGSGLFGSVQLIFKKQDLDLPFPKRRMAALKIQELTDGTAGQSWLEMRVMKCVRHRNIVDYYGAFVVTPRTGQMYEREGEMGACANSPERKSKESQKPLGARYAESQEESCRGKQCTREKKKETYLQTEDMFCILMEYANAGTLETEIKRYPAGYLTEEGARCYMREIIDGVSYLHSKNIAHKDLHVNNVVLKYNQDGVTKRCMICDFGVCLIPTSPAPGSTESPVLINFMPDINSQSRSLKSCMERMLKGLIYDADGKPVKKPTIPAQLSNEAKDVLRDKTTTTCEYLLQFPWFTGPADPPIVGKPRDEVLPGELLNANVFTRQARQREAEEAAESYQKPEPNDAQVYRSVDSPGFKHVWNVRTDPGHEAVAQRVRAHGREQPGQQEFTNSKRLSSSSSSEDPEAGASGLQPPPRSRPGRGAKKASFSSSPDDSIYYTVRSRDRRFAPPAMATASSSSSTAPSSRGQGIHESASPSGAQARAPFPKQRETSPTRRVPSPERDSSTHAHGSSHRSPRPQAMAAAPPASVAAPAVKPNMNRRLMHFAAPTPQPPAIPPKEHKDRGQGEQ